VSRTIKKEGMPGIFIHIASIVLLLLAAGCAAEPPYLPVDPVGRTFVINTAALPEKIPLFYRMPADGADVTFFVVKVDGAIESYFNRCAACKSKKLGYFSDGQYVICRVCNDRLPVDKLREGFGSCYPFRLAGRLGGEKGGEKDVIEKEDVRKGKKYFE
jgi:uncharacterized membrane protein